MKNQTSSTRSPWAARLFGLVLVCIGIALGWGGVELATLGGSLYYLITGALLVVSGILLLMGRGLGLGIFALVFVSTLVWALSEVGLNFWPLVPRVAPVLVLGIVAALVAPGLLGQGVRKPAFTLAGVLVVLGLGGFASMFQPHGLIEAKVQPEEHQKVKLAESGPDS
jgi:quinate dehydrogenase (quinone)